MSGCEIMKCKWWRGTSQSCAEPIGVCIYSQDAAITALRNELAEYKRLCQGHVLAEQQWREENERLKDGAHKCQGMANEINILTKENASILTLLAGTEKELEQYRKVVGLLGRGWDYWFISDSDAKANNLDIAGMKERK